MIQNQDQYSSSLNEKDQQTNIKCQYHNDKVSHIYLNDDQYVHLVCPICRSEKEFQNKYLIDIGFFANNNKYQAKIQPFSLLSDEQEQDLQRLISMNLDIKSYQKKILFFYKQIAENIKQIKDQTIEYFNQIEAEQLKTEKMISQIDFIGHIKQALIRFLDNPKELNSCLRQLIEEKKSVFHIQKQYAEDQILKYKNLFMQQDQQSISSDFESLFEAVKLIRQRYLPNNPLEIAISSQYKKPLCVNSLKELQSIQNIDFYEQIKINLSNQNIKDQSLKIASDLLKQCKNINRLSLNLIQNQLSDQSINSVCQMLKEMPNLNDLQLLFCDNNQITSNGVIQLINELKNYKGQFIALLLGFGDNKNINDDIIHENFIPLFIECSKLKYFGLNLQNTNIGNSSLKQITYLIQNSFKDIISVSLNLSQNRLDSDIVIKLFSEGIVHVSSQIKQIRLGLNKINMKSGKQILSIMKFIEAYTNLEQLIFLFEDIFLSEPVQKLMTDFLVNVKEICFSKLKYIGVKTNYWEFKEEY